MSAQAQYQGSPALLSGAPTTAGHRKVALAVFLLALATCLATIPFARTVWGTFPGFILIQQSLQTANCLIISVLIYSQYSIARANGLIVLATGYLVASLLITAHTLSFPGAVSQTGLLTGGPQTTPWLYFWWHIAIPLAVIAYASGRLGSSPDTASGSPRGPILLSILSAVAITGAITGLLIAGHGWLPRFVDNGRLLPASQAAVAVMLLSQLAALFTVARKKPRSVLDLWLMVTMFASSCTVSLVSFFSAQRFDCGWYVGRTFDLLTSTVILLLLLSETVVLYQRSTVAAAVERRERERRLQEMEAVLLHLSRVTELGQNVSTLVHEVSQPLAAISNYLTTGLLALQRPNREHQIKQTLTEAAAEAARAKHIIHNLRGFIEKRDSTKGVEAVRPMLDNAVHLATAGLRDPALQIEITCADGAASAFFNRIQIEQVVFNLVRNAIEAMADNSRRRLKISASLISRDSGQMVEVCVADTGSGLPDEIRERLFEPFVTTKKGGLGVGLSICRIIVEAHGGYLMASENPGGGTIFSFTFPKASSWPETSAPASVQVKAG